MKSFDPLLRVYVQLLNVPIVKSLSLLAFLWIFTIVIIGTPAYSQSHQKTIDSLEKSLIFCQDDTNKVNILNSLSKAYWEIDKYDRAMASAVQARSLAESISFYKGIASADRKIGVVYSSNGAYPQALDFFLKSLAICEKINDRNGSFLSINNIGITYSSMKDYDKALEYFFNAIAYNTDEGYLFNNIGEAYCGKNDYSLAMEYFIKSIKISQSVNDSSQISTEFNNIASIYEQRLDYDNALKYYFQSLEIIIKMEDGETTSLIYGSLGDVYYKKGDYNLALNYEMQSLELSKKIGALKIIENTEKIISDIYSKIGNDTKALEHHRKYLEVKDSLFNETNTKSLVRSEMNFQFEKQQAIDKIKQEKKDAIKSAELDKQKMMRNAFIAGFVLVVLFLSFLFRTYLKEKKDKNTISIQKHLLEEKSKEISENINYATKIQKAMITSDEYIKNNLPESFITYLPHSGIGTVSGDWYWGYRIDDHVMFATVDNTGHGISGAMLSMISISLLNEIVIERKITSPELVLNTLRSEIIKSLNQEGASEQRRDGMDISFCKLSLKTMILECACANNPVLIARNNEIIEMKANRFPVGKYVGEDKPFDLNSIQLQSGDIIATLSDGAASQFGGEKNKKLQMKNVKQWICDISLLPTVSQMKQEFETRFSKWIGNNEQVDDVTLFCIKI